MGSLIANLPVVVQTAVIVVAVLDVVGVGVPDGVVDGGPDGDGVVDEEPDGDGVDNGGPDDDGVADGVADGVPDDDGVVDWEPDGDGIADVGLDCVDGDCSDDVGGDTSAALVINIPVETKLEIKNIWSATNKTCILYSALNYGIWGYNRRSKDCGEYIPFLEISLL